MHYRPPLDPSSPKVEVGANLTIGKSYLLQADPPPPPIPSPTGSGQNGPLRRSSSEESACLSDNSSVGSSDSEAAFTRIQRFCWAICCCCRCCDEDGDEGEDDDDKTSKWLCLREKLAAARDKLEFAEYGRVMLWPSSIFEVVAFSFMRLFSHLGALD